MIGPLEEAEVAVEPIGREEKVEVPMQKMTLDEAALAKAGVKCEGKWLMLTSGITIDPWSCAEISPAAGLPQFTVREGSVSQRERKSVCRETCCSRGLRREILVSAVCPRVGSGGMANGFL